MKDTLQFILTHLVDHPDVLVIDEDESDGKLLLTVHADPSDMGKIIGKNGRIIKAIRDLMKILAAKQNVYVDVVLAEQESDQSDHPPAGGPTNQ